MLHYFEPIHLKELFLTLPRWEPSRMPDLDHKWQHHFPHESWIKRVVIISSCVPLKEPEKEVDVLCMDRERFNLGLAKIYGADLNNAGPNSTSFPSCSQGCLDLLPQRNCQGYDCLSILIHIWIRSQACFVVPQKELEVAFSEFPLRTKG